MENWRATISVEIKRLEEKLEILKTDGLELAELFDSFTVKPPWWGMISGIMVVELGDDEEFKRFPMELLGKLLEKVGMFTKRTSRQSGQVTYEALTKKGLMVRIEIGPAICKATVITKKEWVESEDSHYEFQKECDPLFLDEAQREDDLKTDPVLV